nr:uncharacterized protein LOC104266369 isoform X2 [Ciona intestinalis]XP_026693083.1 uncharacterized protein LOC104266369 isoform X2 [Ciona intestinalis]|eukprot:XP_026693082.1 uncharacterized protein LOC104266369 isoform X2 [Ciona intestinalis]
MEDVLTKKSLYLQILSEVFNRIITDSVEYKATKTKIQFSPLKIANKRVLGDFILPKRLYDVLCLMLGDQDDPKVEVLLQKFVAESKDLPVEVSGYKATKSGIVFQLNRAVLARKVVTTILQKAEDIKKLENQVLPECRRNDVVLCCVDDNVSTARTLTYIAPYMNAGSKETELVFVSKNPEAKFETLLQNTTYTQDSKESYNTNKILTFLSGVTEENRINFDSNADICSHTLFTSFYKKVFNSKIFLNESVLRCLALLDERFKNGENKFQIVCICCQSDNFFMWQLLTLFLIYLHFKTSKNENCSIFEKFSNLNIEMISHGPVNFKGVNTLTSLEQKYQESISDSFVSKYGDTGDWGPLVPIISKSVLKLDVLGCSVPSSVALDANNSSVESRFVMYNYSRLATLLQKYEAEVENGKYPKLPRITEIDFTLLDENEEHTIVDYLWKFDDILDDFYACFDENSQLISSNFKPHLVVAYLRQFCKVLSSFYSRYHVLGRNLSHLLPIMHVRIYLIKAVKIVLLKLFKILNIEPLEQM